MHWILTTYSLSLGGLLILGGRLSYIWGGKRCYVRGYLAFGAGARCCALAPVYPVLILGRCIQGLGGAILVPATLSLAASTFPPGAERIIALSVARSPGWSPAPAA